MPSEEATYTELPVIGADGDEIGTVTDVISDPRTLERLLLVVKTGIIKGEHPVPISIVDHQGDRLAVDVDQDHVNAAPKISDHATPDDRELAEIFEHYGLTAPNHGARA